MQPLTADPRNDLTPDQVRALLTGEGIRRDFGADVQYGGVGPWVDVSGFVHAPWSVSHDNAAEVHGSLSIELTRAFAWGVDRFRPWMTLTDPAGVTARFDAGVYLLSTPTTTHGRDPVVYSCSGKDLLTLATRQVGDTYAVASGATYLDVLRAVFTAAGITEAPQLDGTAQDTPLPADRVWALTANPRWLDVANDLMTEIGYTDVYMSPDGIPAARPIDSGRGPEWTFNTADASTDLIAGDFTETLDLWAAPNQWRFVRNNLAYQPTEGDGVYSVTNASDGPSSVDSVGAVPAQTQWIDSADQASLVAEGDRIVAADRRAEQTFELSVDPLPIAWHRDVVTLQGPDVGSVTTQVTSWELSPLSKGSWSLGGGPGGEPAAPVQVSGTGTITQASPLRVVMDGATVGSPALALADDSGSTPSYSIGNRVQVQVRNPLPPLVQGIETSL